MKKSSFLLSFLFILSGSYVFGQYKSIAIINDVEANLYYVKDKGLVLRYGCEYDQSVFAAQEMMRLLGEKYQVELITLPAECRKKHGMLKNSAKKWLKSLNGQYDVVIYLYSKNKYNERLYYWDQLPLYSSGLYQSGNLFIKNKTRVYSSVTARAYLTKTGIAFYHLDLMAHNATKNKLEDMVYLTDINDPAVCLLVANIIERLITHRFTEFVRGFEDPVKGWDYTF